MAQRDHGIHPDSTARRNEHGPERDGEQQCGHGDEGRGVCRAYAEQQILNQARKMNCSCDAGRDTYRYQDPSSFNSDNQASAYEPRRLICSLVG